jgi:protein TonB
VALLRSPEPVAALMPASASSSPPITDFQAAPAISQPSPPLVDRPEAPPSPPPAPSGSSAQQALASPGEWHRPQAGAALRYQRLLLAHIERYQHYPTAARRDRLQGTVLIAFAMRRDGGLVAVSVKSSSGQQVLDEEAVETVRRAQPLPSIPPDLPEQLTVTLPVAFDLR